MNTAVIMKGTYRQYFLWTVTILKPQQQQTTLKELLNLNEGYNKNIFCIMSIIMFYIICEKVHYTYKYISVQWYMYKAVRAGDCNQYVIRENTIKLELVQHSRDQCGLDLHLNQVHHSQLYKTEITFKYCERDILN